MTTHDFTLCEPPFKKNLEGLSRFQKEQKQNQNRVVEGVPKGSPGAFDSEYSPSRTRRSRTRWKIDSL